MRWCHLSLEFRRLAWSLDGSFLHVLRVEVDLYSIRYVLASSDTTQNKLPYIYHIEIK